MPVYVSVFASAGNFHGSLARDLSLARAISTIIREEMEAVNSDLVRVTEKQRRIGVVVKTVRTDEYTDIKRESEEQMRSERRIEKMERK